MNSKLEKGKEGSKKSTAAPKKNLASQKATKRHFEEELEDDWDHPEMDEFDQESDVFDEPRAFKKKEGKGKNTKDEDFYDDFDDDLRGLGFLDDSFYDDDDDLY